MRPKITCFAYLHVINNPLYMFPLGEIISSLHLFIDRYVNRITMYAVFYAKPIINRYCQLSSYFHVDSLCVSSHFCAERIAVFHVDAIRQTAVKPHRFHLYRAIVAISPVKRRRVDEWRGSGSSDGDQILTKACSRADEGGGEGRNSARYKFDKAAGSPQDSLVI